MIGHLYTLLLVGGGTAAPPVASGAGKGSSLADYEAEWARKRAEQALEAAQDAPAQVRRRIKREAARKIYFDPLPDVAQVYVERLKAEKEAAKLAEMRALLDLAAQTSAIQAEIARAAVLMAQRKRAEAERAIEEFDVMYVAAILAEA